MVYCQDSRFRLRNKFIQFLTATVIQVIGRLIEQDNSRAMDRKSGKE